jgi:hypothetical protein
MVALGEVNSRYKDFYDVWFLAQYFDFDAVVLATAVRTTFARRGTELPRAPRPLTETFGQDDGRSVAHAGDGGWALALLRFVAGCPLDPARPADLRRWGDRRGGPGRG